MISVPEPHIIGNMNKSRAVSISVAVCLCLLASSSCANKSSKFKFTMQRDAVMDMVGQNVRTEKVYRDLDTILIADVLLYKPEIKRSGVKQAKDEGRIDAEQDKEMFADIADKESKEVEFLAGVYTGDKRWNDLDKNNSMWRVTLKTADGSWVTPSSITKLKLDKMQDAWLFPFLTEWKYAYRIVFPKTPAIAGVNSYTLRITSVVGEGTFNWDLTPPK